MHKLLLESERTGIAPSVPVVAASLRQAAPERSHRERGERLARDTPPGDSPAPGRALGPACSRQQRPAENAVRIAMHLPRVQEAARTGTERWSSPVSSYMAAFVLLQHS